MPFLSLMIGSLAALGAIAIITILTFYACLFCTLVAGVVLLVVASRLRRSPEFQMRHRVLTVVCTVLGVVAVIIGIVSLVLFTIVLATAIL